MRPLSQATLCVHAGNICESHNRGLRSPLYPSTSHAYLDATTDLYPRHGNLPNQISVAQKLAQLEHAEDAIMLTSGMSAISYALLSSLKSGDHLITQGRLYSGALRYITQHLPKLGISHTVAEGTEVDAICKCTRANTKVLYLESPTNPTLNVVNVQTLANWSKQQGIITILDNTIATPINQRPIELGIDLVVHSVTKFLGGHSDLSGGAVIGSRSLVNLVREYAHEVGGFLDPANCHLLERSLQTLALRIEKSNQNASKIAEILNDHPAVNRVYYPGLRCHPNHEIARQQMSGFGGVLSFELKDSICAHQFQRNLKLIKPANSLGEVVTSLNCPALASTSYASLSPEQKQASGISSQFIRMSVGIEGIDDLLEDLTQALET
jgi:cystathionine beta-lyase/cystathionine gamma-synthase